MNAIHRAVPRLGLNRSEVALAIGVSANTVDVMVREGALPPPRRWNNRKIWLVAEIEAAMLEWPADGTAPAIDDDADHWRASL